MASASSVVDDRSYSTNLRVSKDSGLPDVAATSAQPAMVLRKELQEFYGRVIDDGQPCLRWHLVQLGILRAAPENLLLDSTGDKT